MKTLEKFIAEQFEANLFDGCYSREDVKFIVFDMDIDTLEFIQDDIIDAAWNYIVERNNKK